MRRRDELTYDVDLRRRREVPWRSIAVLAVVVVLAVVLVGWTVSSRPGGSSEQAAPSAALTSADTPSPSAPMSPSAASSLTSAVPSGSDDGENPGGAPVGSVQAVSGFVQAWLARDPKIRKDGLAATAVPALAEQLQLTSAANIPQARVAGAPVVEDASAYSVQFVQGLSSGMKIRVYLVADPQARFGWSATSVERV